MTVLVMIFWAIQYWPVLTWWDDGRDILTLIDPIDWYYYYYWQLLLMVIPIIIDDIVVCGYLLLFILMTCWWILKYYWHYWYGIGIVLHWCWILVLTIGGGDQWRWPYEGLTQLKEGQPDDLLIIVIVGSEGDHWYWCVIVVWWLLWLMTDPLVGWWLHWFIIDEHWPIIVIIVEDTLWRPVDPVVLIPLLVGNWWWRTEPSDDLGIDLLIGRYWRVTIEVLFWYYRDIRWR